LIEDAEMLKKTTLKDVAMSLLFFTMALLQVGTVLTGDANGQSVMGTQGLQPQPAALSAAATKAMMLDSTTAGKRIVAVGDHGIILLSDDSGATFRQAKTVPVRSTLTAVDFTDDKMGWAVGHWGIILATTDGGENWNIQRSDTSVDQPLFSVRFKDRDNGIAVGLWSLVLNTADGGKSWDSMDMPPPPGSSRGDLNLFSLFASKQGSLLIAAERGAVYRSVDGGTTWSCIPTGYAGSFWTGISLPSGTLLVAGLRGTIYRSTDDGKSWQEVVSGVKSSLTDFASSDGRVYAVGLDGVLLESSDDGMSFVATQRDDRMPLTALALAGSGEPFAFSKAGILMNPFAKRKE
jgi:photosystem II stability/assembly factor-like uncharacterized protein